MPYSRKIWRGIKLGGLAVRVETAILKFTNIIFARNSLIIPLWKVLTWHCCNSSQSASCRSWVVSMNLHSNSVPHNMWSVVCKVDLKRIRRGWSCDHWGCRCDCGCVWCSNTCQENDKCTQFFWTFCYTLVLYLQLVKIRLHTPAISSHVAILPSHPSNIPHRKWAPNSKTCQTAQCIQCVLFYSECYIHTNQWLTANML